MKPLLAKDLETFLDRFQNFVDSEIKDIEIISPTKIAIIFATQDKVRGFDWVNVKIEFDNISDAKLIDDTKFKHLDMNDGISIIYEQNLFAFGIGKCYNISSTKNSICFLVCSNLKYKESIF